jgi:predicted hydrocarbon binding protein
MSMPNRKYAFSWDTVGVDIAAVRPGLGASTRVEVYRLLQFTLRDVIEQQYGTEVADKLFFDAGVLAGRAFYERYCQGAANPADLLRIIQEQFRELGIGIVRFEKADTEAMQFQLTVDEDLDCSGFPDTSDHICIYDEGFIKGILDTYTGLNFAVSEIDCWCSGARTCRFRGTVADNSNE